MFVILNKDSSVNYVMENIEELQNLHFDEENGMSLVEMFDFKDTSAPEDYAEYFVIDGNWVHFDQIKPETLGKGEPPELK